MPKAFTSQEKEIIRNRLHEKGALLFQTHGLRKTSVDDLVKAVGISKGAFYLFFDSKEELFLEILEGIEENHRRNLLHIPISPDDDAVTSVAKLLKGLVFPLSDYMLLATFDQSDYEYLLRKIAPQRLESHIHHDQQFIREFNEKISREGIEIKCSTERISNLFQCLFFITLHRNDLGDVVYHETMDILTDLVARYLVEGK